MREASGSATSSAARSPAAAAASSDAASLPVRRASMTACSARSMAARRASRPPAVTAALRRRRAGTPLRTQARARLHVVHACPQNGHCRRGMLHVFGTGHGSGPAGRRRRRRLVYQRRRRRCKVLHVGKQGPMHVQIGAIREEAEAQKTRTKSSVAYHEGRLGRGTTGPGVRGKLKRFNPHFLMTRHLHKKRPPRHFFERTAEN